MKFFWILCLLVLVVVARRNSRRRDAQIRKMLSRDGSGKDTDEVVAGLKKLNHRKTRVLKSKQDRKTAKLLKKLNHEGGSDPLPSHDIAKINEVEGLNDFLFEGDVLLTPDQIHDLESDDVDRKKRMSEYGYNWKKFDISKPIGYTLNGSFSDKAIDAIHTAVELFNTKTCIKFEENDTDYQIEFVRKDGCWSSIGKVYKSESQEISIGSGCEYVSTVVHEIGHALSFVHEQTRHDRDAYVVINEEQVEEGKLHNFNKKHFVSNYSHEYDYGSVMHYGAYFFSISYAEPTILAKDPMYQTTMGKTNPQLLDWLSVNQLYGCEEKCPQLDCQHGGYTNPNDCNKCVCADAWTGDHCETRSPGRGPQVERGTCGKTLTATTDWQTVEVEVGESYRWPEVQDECFWTIEMDDQCKKNVELIVTNVQVDSSNCGRAGGQIYTNSNSRSNPITFCSAWDYAVNRTIVSTGITVIRGFSNSQRSRFAVEYRIAP